MLGTISIWNSCERRYFDQLFIASTPETSTAGANARLFQKYLGHHRLAAITALPPIMALLSTPAF
jgi:hypothetical protein